MGNSKAPPPAEPARRPEQKTAQALWPRESEVAGFFGRIELGPDGQPRERWQISALTTLSLPYPMRLAWDTGTVVRRITCHRGVARSLGQILSEILAHYGSVEKVREARMDLYGGCYNFRSKRGGHSLSMHSYGIAIDLDPERNGLGVEWKPKAGMMPEAVVAIFERHGWTWGGRWKRPDAMHFQATRG